MVQICPSATFDLNDSNPAEKTLIQYFELNASQYSYAITKRNIPLPSRIRKHITKTWSIRDDSIGLDESSALLFILTIVKSF